MLLTDDQIKSLIDDEKSGLIINPFDPTQLQGASYDLKVGKRLLISGEEKEYDLSDVGSVGLPPAEFAVLTSHEYFEIPQDMVINIGPKTYLTKKGIILQAGMQIDPGFKGYLFLGLYNSSPRKFLIEYLGDLCSIQIFKLHQKARKVFPERHNNVEGKFPREMKDYLYSLETKSLTTLGEDVRALTKNVSSMSDKISDLGAQVGALKTIILSVTIPLGIGLLLIILQNLLE